MKRTIEAAELLAVSPTGADVDIGFRLQGVAQGVALGVKTETLSEIAFVLLAAGHDAAKAGHSLPTLSTSDTFPNALGCTQMGIAKASSGDGITCLVMRFGSTELAVRVSTSDIRTALGLLERPEDLHQPPTGMH